MVKWEQDKIVIVCLGEKWWKFTEKKSIMNKKKPYYVFLGQTVLYFIVLLGLLYFFSYLGQGQGGFIYNEF